MEHLDFSRTILRDQVMNFSRISSNGTSTPLNLYAWIFNEYMRMK